MRSTAEIGVFKLTQETSERRQRAPDRGDHRARSASSCCASTTASCTTRRSRCARSRTRSPTPRRRAVAKRRELEKQLAKGAGRSTTRSATIVDIDGVKAVFEIREVPNPKALPDLADRLKGQLGDPAVVVLGAPGEGRASLLVAATPGAVERGVKAGAIVKVAAAVVGGGGGGRDNMAQAGGKDPEKLPGRPGRRARGDRARACEVLALDYGVGALRRRGQRSDRDAGDAARARSCGPASKKGFAALTRADRRARGRAGRRSGCRCR